MDNKTFASNNQEYSFITHNKCKNEQKFNLSMTVAKGNNHMPLTSTKGGKNNQYNNLRWH